ncbi:unnamed protein product [Phytophthora fragariaefolia]|uniref:Unnamed protein product n=1 Tax=Phytophthora fragariaefolia TaxID=1490495 RepID=A0A9W7CV96_9STRA|nr:unnamed protein product [Phytophthora fragariaefolia]
MTSGTAVDGKRCLICGCELERRHAAAPGAQSIPAALLGGSETSVQELQAMAMRLLTQIGGDWGGEDNGARRPASDEAGKVPCPGGAAEFVWLMPLWWGKVGKLGSFEADQASTTEVAVVVKGIKGEVG